ncbi:MAG: sugar kinase [Anaerobiospirillum succiniciproducens]|uniref:sugar kinase n=1 Tax=Anaerobiospirillum succiniciproducens TaxID=13335 RepID=UPI002A7535F9|nr:sugar kinase [Anaerobiospirillum succiniciproducens]MDY2798732.1 sugar kinase [Anaerobiospirillum succiniciproducens]
MAKGLLLAGEPMGLLIAQSEGSLDSVAGFTLAVAGAEFNVATGAARLGHFVSYLTKLGNDPFGTRITNTLTANKIDSSDVLTSDTNTTGFMLKSKVSKGDPEIFYFRKGSAASTLDASDVEKIDFSKFDYVHLTGIFPALTDSTRAAMMALIKKAKELGLFISFDPNLRPQLWPSQEVMVKTLNELASYADLVLPGCGEGKILCGSEDPSKINDFYRSLGARMVVTKLGPDGALVREGDNEYKVPGFIIDKVVDTVGAGDGFACGVITGLMEGLSLEKAVERGAAIGAIQCTFAGDNEGLPTQEQLKEFMQSHRRVAL